MVSMPDGCICAMQHERQAPFSVLSQPSGADGLNHKTSTVRSPAHRVYAERTNVITESCRQPYRPSARGDGAIACVVDMDNLCSRRGKFGRRAWAQLDVLRFAAALNERGVNQGTVCQHQSFGACASKIWAGLGLKPISTHENADERVKLEAVTYALNGGLDWLILVASDGGYAEVIDAIRNCSIKVELWALRDAASRDLLYLADRIRWIDYLVDEPRPPDQNGRRSANEFRSPQLHGLAA